MSTVRSTRRARLTRRAALAVLAAGAIGGGVVAATPSAFAASCTGTACSSYTGSVVVGSNLTLFPSTGTFGTVTVAADGTQHTLGKFILDVSSSDSAGAALSFEMPTTPADLAVNMFASDSYAYPSYTKGQTFLATAGVPVNIYNPTTTTGLAQHCSSGPIDGFGGGVCSVNANGNTINGTQLPAGSDVLNLTAFITVPAGTPGTSNAGSNIELDYALLGA